eukprot:NODE_6240_length_520_cov_246.369892.p1 GENE.NODE_6240_length_520_cov_246.369892~~NODE_6240_length_520_cov_246.369892.p1  ORF type:complete len:149 (+),score=7.62 NODE_6240_length_520_cov_246.369892:51-449(+)
MAAQVAEWPPHGGVVPPVASKSWPYCHRARAIAWKNGEHILLMASEHHERALGVGVAAREPPHTMAVLFSPTVTAVWPSSVLSNTQLLALAAEGSQIVVWWKEVATAAAREGDAVSGGEGLAAAVRFNRARG